MSLDVLRILVTLRDEGTGTCTITEYTVIAVKGYVATVFESHSGRLLSRHSPAWQWIPYFSPGRTP